jgi:hypothetical protein
MKIIELIHNWEAAKALEKQAVTDRRNAEDNMVKALVVAKDLDGTKNYMLDNYKVSVVGRIDRKVDSEKVQELAAEHGLEEHLASLFRWKPEINSSVWSSTSEEITKLLLPAITSKPGRPSFTITSQDK